MGREVHSGRARRKRFTPKAPLDSRSVHTTNGRNTERSAWRFARTFENAQHSPPRPERGPPVPVSASVNRPINLTLNWDNQHVHKHLREFRINPNKILLTSPGNPHIIRTCLPHSPSTHLLPSPRQSSTTSAIPPSHSPTSPAPPASSSKLSPPGPSAPTSRKSSPASPPPHRSAPGSSPRSTSPAPSRSSPPRSRAAPTTRTPPVAATHPKPSPHARLAAPNPAARQASSSASHATTSNSPLTLPPGESASSRVRASRPHPLHPLLLTVRPMTHPAHLRPIPPSRSPSQPAPSPLT